MSQNSPGFETRNCCYCCNLAAQISILTISCLCLSVVRSTVTYLRTWVGTSQCWFLPEKLWRTWVQLRALSGPADTTCLIFCGQLRPHSSVTHIYHIHRDCWAQEVTICKSWCSVFSFLSVCPVQREDRTYWAELSTNIRETDDLAANLLIWLTKGF